MKAEARAADLLFLASGTIGDFLRTVALAREMVARRHRVTILGSRELAPLVTRHAIPYVPLPESQYARQESFADGIWRNNASSIETWMRHVVLPSIEQEMEVVSRLVSADTCVVLSHLNLGARLVLECLRTRFAVLYYHPFALREPAGEVTRRSNSIVGEVNQFRVSLGLAPIPALYPHWIASPTANLCLFPRWIVPPVAYLPPELSFAGFPITSSIATGAGESNVSAIETDLRQKRDSVVHLFLTGTTGTLLKNVNAYLDVAMDVVSRRGEVGIFVDSSSAHPLCKLGQSFYYVGFTPLAELLPYVDTVTHHGGIGTLADSLAAGLPQVIVPVNADQPHNARTLREMRVAVIVEPHAVNQRNLDEALDRVLQPEVREQCRSVARTHRGDFDGVEQACRRLEAIAGITRV